MTRKRAKPEGASGLRLRAEERLREKGPDDQPPTTYAESQRLIHELQVHQVELELQNEELRQARNDAESALEKYSDLYNFAPVGYLTLDRNGFIRAANLTGASLLGIERSRLIGRRFDSLVMPESRHAFSTFIGSVFESQGKGAFEVALIEKKGKRPLHMQIEATALMSGQECRIALIDITERKQLEELQAFMAQTYIGTSELTFFQELARYLAMTLGMNFVCIDRLAGDGLNATTLAVWCDGRFEDNETYALKDTPCGDVVGKTVCCFPAGVTQFFPHDQVLRNLRAESYIGVTLWSHTGRPIGLIAVIGRKKLTNTLMAESMLKLVAIRAAGELERLDAEATMRKSEHQLADAQRITHIGSWEWDALADEISGSNEFDRIFGHPLSSYDSFMELVHPDDREAVSKSVRETLLHQAPYDIHYRIVRPDGTTRVIHAQGAAITDGAGKSRGMMGTAQDVTEKREMEEKLQNMLEGLEIKVKARTEELTRANEQLTREIDERKKAEESLNEAFSEIKQLQDRLLAENIYLQQEVAREHNFGEIIGQSKALSKMLTRVEQVAKQNATVLLLGETGTGKGLIARAIHSRSSRKDRPMISVNCTALPANLIESELFGREKGAFTGADARQMGRFELANGGTIFLDEIGEMPLELQCKLLRVIQDGEFERLGSPHTIKADVRIIAASNRNLKEEIRNGRFREDLFYRLNVFPITIPPLREHREDIPLLVNHFVAKYNKKTGKRINMTSKETLNALQEYHWPGNVRELEAVIERAVITSQGTVLQVLDRLDAVRKTGEPDGKDAKALAELEQGHIIRVLLKTDWRIEGERGAATILGLNPSTLRSRMRKYGIRRQ